MRSAGDGVRIVGVGIAAAGVRTTGLAGAGTVGLATGIAIGIGLAIRAALAALPARRLTHLAIAILGIAIAGLAAHLPRAALARATLLAHLRLIGTGQRIHGEGTADATDQTAQKAYARHDADDLATELGIGLRGNRTIERIRNRLRRLGGRRIVLLSGLRSLRTLLFGHGLGRLPVGVLLLVLGVPGIEIEVSHDVLL